MTKDSAIQILTAMKAREESMAVSRPGATVGQQLSAQSASRNAEALAAAIEALSA